MSGRFGVLKQKLSAPAAVAQSATDAGTSGPTDKAAWQDRAGKMMVGGHFSHQLGRTIKVLAAESGVTVQSLVGEALDDLLRKYGKHPFGER